MPGVNFNIVPLAPILKVPPAFVTFKPPAPSVMVLPEAAAVMVTATALLTVIELREIVGTAVIATAALNIKSSPATGVPAGDHTAVPQTVPLDHVLVTAIASKEEIAINIYSITNFEALFLRKEVSLIVFMFKSDFL